MRYGPITKGIFRRRPNRFIAIVEIDGAEEMCHVKNTGRCKELLIDGVTVILQMSDGPGRKTKYDLIAVYKGGMLINIDSQAPNKAFLEYIMGSDAIPDLVSVRPEYTYGDSRFDFMAETSDGRIMIEVKGVTLETDGIAMFPDAPTERGVRHVRELIRCTQDGFRSYLAFVVQMKPVSVFTPNREMHGEFADAVNDAADNGVSILAFDCIVTEDSMEIDGPVPIRL